MEHACNVRVAKEYDLATAHFLQHLKFWTFKNLANKKHIHDGFCWTYDSLEALCDIFPYWTKRQLERVINNAVKAGLVIRGNYNKTTYDRTCWYALTYKSYWYFPELADPKYLELLYSSISPNGEMAGNAHFTEWGNGFPQTVTPIPDTNPDTKRKPPIVPQDTGTDIFKDFWNLYPRKNGKEHALKWFKKNKPTEEFALMIMEDIKKRLQTDWKGKEMQFIPHPASYLNGKRWEDEIMAPSIENKGIPPKIPTVKEDTTAFGIFLTGIRTDIKLGLIDEIPQISIEEWKLCAYGEDHRGYLKRLNVEVRKVPKRP